jgi:hypothetical protein
MPRVISYVPAILAQFAREEHELVTAAGLLLKTEVRRLMTAAPRGGRVYNVARGGRGVRRLMRRELRASAPGEPPAVLTGRLRRSIQFKLRLTPRGYEAAVGSNRVGAATLEYGNRFIRPRPVWRPALANVLPKIKALFDRA